MTFTQSACEIPKNKIANLINSYWRAVNEAAAAKQKTRDLTLEMAEMAVELGMSQSAIVGGARPEVFLDGFLAGAGVLPLARTTSKEGDLS